MLWSNMILKRKKKYKTINIVFFRPYLSEISNTCRYRNSRALTYKRVHIYIVIQTKKWEKMLFIFQGILYNSNMEFNFGNLQEIHFCHSIIKHVATLFFLFIIIPVLKEYLCAGVYRDDYILFGYILNKSIFSCIPFSPVSDKSL